MSGIIKAIQQVSITIGVGNLSNTAAITAVNTANAILIYQGVNTTETSGDIQADSTFARIELTNGTTVTATRGVTTSSVTVNATVVEFQSGVNSIQSGTISLTSAQASGTATISAVGTNAFVLHLGSLSNGNQDFSGGVTGVVLTNSTTVTVFYDGAGASGAAPTTTGYMVVDLDTTVVSSIQVIKHTDATTALSYTDTISAVNTNNTVIAYNGVTLPDPAQTDQNANHTIQLTNSTTVTMTRQGSNATQRSIYYTLVQFVGAVLNSAIQRGIISLFSQTSNTATISSVTTAQAFVNYAGQRNRFSLNDDPSKQLLAITLTNATTVTATVNTSNAAQTQFVSFEAIEFAPTLPGPGGGYFPNRYFPDRYFPHRYFPKMAPSPPGGGGIQYNALLVHVGHYMNR